MLHLLLGTDWTANRDEVMKRIAADVAGRRGNRILMVPELISHETERRLCAAAGDTASRYAEVLSFTRLARRVADSMGSAAEECLDNGGRVVAMAAAAKNLSSRSESLCRRGDEAGVPYRPYRRRGRIQALLHFLGRLEPRRRGDGGQSGAEAGRTVASDGELRRFVQPGQARPERPDDVAFGTDGAGGLCPGACVLHRRLPGFYPAASGDSGTSHSGVPRRDGEPELRPGGFPPSGL